MRIPESGNILIRLNVAEDVVIGVDSRDILQEIQSARQDWLATRMKCEKVGHFAKVCKTKEEDTNRPKKGNIHQVTKDDDFAFTFQSSGRDIPIIDIDRARRCSTGRGPCRFWFHLQCY